MLVELKKLTKNYSRQDREFSAVEEVDFSMDQDFVSIIGRSGSGKTTLLNMIAGLLTPSSGEVLFESENIFEKNDDERSFYRNDKIGFIPQQSALLSNLNVIENIVLPFYLYSRVGDPYGQAQLLLEELEISKLIKSYPRELSGGEKKRVLIARALINEPKLLIADEPTADLDIATTELLMKSFKKLSERMGILVVTHELDTTQYADQIYTMSEGKLSLGNSIR